MALWMTSSAVYCSVLSSAVMTCSVAVLKSSRWFMKCLLRTAWQGFSSWLIVFSSCIWNPSCNPKWYQMLSSCNKEETSSAHSGSDTWWKRKSEKLKCGICSWLDRVPSLSLDQSCASLMLTYNNSDDDDDDEGDITMEMKMTETTTKRRWWQRGRWRWWWWWR